MIAPRRAKEGGEGVEREKGETGWVAVMVMSSDHDHGHVARFLGHVARFLSGHMTMRKRARSLSGPGITREQGHAPSLGILPRVG